MVDATVPLDATKPSERPLCTPEDMRALAQLPASFAAAWLLPESRLEWLAALSSRRNPERTRARTDRRTAWACALVGERMPPEQVRAAVEQSNVHQSLLQLQLLRCLRPLPWRPRTELVGREHLNAALAAGRGAILWLGPCIHTTLAVKVAFAAAGYAVSHLSRYQHGRFTSRFGIRVLNGITRRAEDLFLAERIVIGPGQTAVAATRALSKRLRNNGIVSITAGREGTEVRVPLLNGTLVLANGAAKLALATGAALLPVLSFRQPDGVFRTIIDAPLQPDPAHGDAIRSIHTAFAERLTVHILEHFDQHLVHDRNPIIELDGTGADLGPAGSEAA
jgi:KDO2-lipid IV(A) lauroyltransferase